MVNAPLCFGLGILAGYLTWRMRRDIRRNPAVMAMPATALLLFLGGGYSFWYHHRPPPAPWRQELFRGVGYTREIRSSPRPLIVHVVTIALDDPGVRFLVTPGDASAEYPLRARTTSQFLDEFQVQVAINAGFIQPWHYNNPWDYYPHVGDPVRVKGVAISEGLAYSAAEEGYHTLFLAGDNRATISVGAADAHNAISGRDVLVKAGRATGDWQRISEPFILHPRTVVALDADRKRLFLIVVDGRQPNYSEGVTLPELAQIVIEHGADTALLLDGGGSSTLVVEGPDGMPAVLNSPIHVRALPGRERPVANHLGVFAERR